MLPSASAPQTAPAAGPAGSQIQHRRLTQVLYLSLAAMLISAVQHATEHNWRTVIILGLTSVVLLLARWLGRRGHQQLSAGLMLGALTAMTLGFAWLNQGTHDPAVLALPGILVFAAMLGARRLFVSLLLAMLLVMALVVMGNVQGWHVNIIKPIRLASFIDIGAVLLVIAFCVWRMADDLRRALLRLEDENLRVRQSQGRIEYLAQHDVLTGLPNRHLARERFEQTLALARRDQHMAALLFLDLDNFKTINDSLGHAAGDELLCLASQRLSGWVRGSDTVCRQGGDEFLVILGGLTDADVVADVALKLSEVLGEPYMLNGLAITVTCSIGIALFPEDGSDFPSLMQKADMAMYRAKESGRNAFRFFDAEMNSSVVEHLHLISGMRTALQTGQFVLHYQPQFDLASGAVVGAEALLRWRHPELGLIPPAKFIPVAEKSGLIIEIGEWVLRDACQQAMRWREDEALDLLLSVNLSPVQFRRGDIERVVINALDESGLPAQSLELELTESLLIDDSSQLSEQLARLRALGCSFSIDDFGTGYSNLGYLKRFEVERLKIDQSFVRRLTEQRQDEAIVSAIIQMAGSLELGTVAEGIEDAATLARLCQLGCERGQGFYWSPALPAGEFLAFVQAHARLAPDCPADKPALS